MKKMNPSYRLQMIREIAIKKQAEQDYDPMADYITNLLHDKPSMSNQSEFRQEFSGSFFDESVGGWVSNAWREK